MTSCEKTIWNVVFQEQDKSIRENKVAAYNLMEVLSFYNERGKASIIKIEKTKDKITYQY